MVSQPMTYLNVVTVLLFYLIHFFCKYQHLAFAFQIIMCLINYDVTHLTL